MLSSNFSTITRKHLLTNARRNHLLDRGDILSTICRASPKHGSSPQSAGIIRRSIQEESSAEPEGIANPLQGRERETMEGARPELLGGFDHGRGMSTRSR